MDIDMERMYMYIRAPREDTKCIHTIEKSRI